jgi:HSP20 family molecular chaperone IbpA
MSRIIRNFSNPVQNNILPDLFDPWSFKELFDVDSAFQNIKTPYPTNIYGVPKKDSSEMATYFIEVALAGIGKENISVTVDKDMLNLEVEVKDKDQDIKYFKKGISQKTATMTFGISNININKIKTSYIDGILKIELPVKVKEVTKKVIVID